MIPTPSDLERAAEWFVGAANIGRIEFYCAKSDFPEASNKPLTLGCRLFPIDPMLRIEAMQLADELNRAISDVKEQWAKRMFESGQNRLIEKD